MGYVYLTDANGSAIAESVLTCSYPPCQEQVFVDGDERLEGKANPTVVAPLTRDADDTARTYLFCSEEHAEAALDWQDEHTRVVVGEDGPVVETYLGEARADDARY